MKTAIPDNNGTDGPWVTLDKFQQVVNINESGVQIPIEIYDGGYYRSNYFLWIYFVVCLPSKDFYSAFLEVFVRFLFSVNFESAL